MRRWIPVALLLPFLAACPGNPGVVQDRNNPPCHPTNPGAGKDSPCLPKDYKLKTNGEWFSVTKDQWSKCTVGEKYPDCYQPK